MRVHAEVLLRQYVLNLLLNLRSQTHAAAATAFVVEYALVTFRDIPPFADYLVRSSKFTTDPAMVHNWAKTIPFRGASTTGRTHVAAGLCAALQLGQQHDAHQRCVVLITNNVPRALSCGICEAGGDALSHASVAAQRRVCLSVISSRRLDELVNIFNNADLSRHGTLEGSSWVFSPLAVQSDPAKALYPAHYVALRALAIPPAIAAQRQAAGMTKTETTATATPSPSSAPQTGAAVAAAAPLRATRIHDCLLYIHNLLPVPSPIEVTVSVLKPEWVQVLGDWLRRSPDGLQLASIRPNMSPQDLVQISSASYQMLIDPRTEQARLQLEQLKQALPSTSLAALQPIVQRRTVLRVQDGRVVLLLPNQTQQNRTQTVAQAVVS